MIITRFAPSPSGYLHIGNIRIAIISWIFAKKNFGKFILRIENTNEKISNKIFIKNIYKDIKWIGLKWDNKIIIQSNRIKKYNKVIDELINSNLAYPCFCSKERLRNLKIFQIKKKISIKYDNYCRNKNFSYYKLKNYKNVIRFKNPINSYTNFKDEIYGELKFNNNELDDIIIRRENGIPTYNFCVVLDDVDANVTHIIRGSDHISNTPKQINILNSMGYKIPNYIHIPIILDEKKNKLSKKNNNLNLKEFKKDGFLSKSIFHYLISIGNSNFENFDKSILSKSYIINNFNINKINKSSIIFDKKKLLFINKNYLCKLPNKKINKIFIKYVNSNNIKNYSKICLYNMFNCLKHKYFLMKDIIEKNKFLLNKIYINKNLNLNINNNIFIIIDNFIKNISNLNNWKLYNIINFLEKNINIYNDKKLIYSILRILLTGDLNSSELSIIIYILGKKLTLKRLKNVKNLLNN